MRRRTYLKATGAAVAGTAVVGTAQATDLETVDEAFDHVETTYEEDTLETYQPQLDMSPDAVQRLRHLVSYVARSDEYDTYVCCYIARYTHQEGITGTDSHLWDTEPVYVFVDEETDEPTEAVWTGWHWNAAGIDADVAEFHEHRSDEPTHLSLSVVDPWGNYTYNSEDRGAFVDLDDWHSRREFLVDGGLYDRGEAAAFEEPWVMSAAHDARSGWWTDSGAVEAGVPPTVNVDYVTMQLWRLLGAGGWDERSERLR